MNFGWAGTVIAPWRVLATLDPTIFYAVLIIVIVICLALFAFLVVILGSEYRFTVCGGSHHS
jgi:hypothetical protein